MSMPRPGLVALALSLGITVAHAGQPGADGWEEISNKDGVKVYRRSVEGSPLKSMRGVGVVQAPVRTVALVLLDDDRATEWVDSLAESKVVRLLSPHEYVEYNHVKMPWPVKDREFVTRVSLQSLPNEKSCLIRSVPTTDPLVKPSKHVRGELSGYYKLTAIDGGKATLLEIELHSDPKGSIPAWVVNLFQKSWARETIAAIRKQVKKTDLVTPKDFASFLSELDFATAPEARSP